MISTLNNKIIGVSLKMYMDLPGTIKWASQVDEKLRNHASVINGDIGIFILPSFPLISEVRSIFKGSNIKVGAQHLSQHDVGAFTGEVSPKLLKQLDCDYVEIGHHERRKYHAESNEIISQKVLAAFRNSMVPIICVGESEANGTESALRETVDQVKSALLDSASFNSSPLVIAYEPSWAIGGENAADSAHISSVCEAIKTELLTQEMSNFKVIYGGSAGPGLFAGISTIADGLFLGRRAHDPIALVQVVEEISNIK